MSATFTRLAATACVAVAAAASSPADAVTLFQSDLVQGPSSCVPAQPTDPVRNRMGGVRNSGAATIYLICALPGDPADPGTGVDVSYASIRLKNTGAAAADVQCVLHTGPATSSVATAQASAVQSTTLGSANTVWFDFWADAVVGNKSLANATFICKVPPKVEVMYVFQGYDEEMGA